MCVCLGACVWVCVCVEILFGDGSTDASSTAATPVCQNKLGKLASLGSLQDRRSFQAVILLFLFCLSFKFGVANYVCACVCVCVREYVCVCVCV